jgi:UDP-N-acetylglucosamine 2-epimerase (non-hydrolysing)
VDSPNLRLAEPRGSGPTVWLVGGTRPEALKLAPVVLAVNRQGLIRPVVVATGQHPSMFHRGLATFGLRPQRDLHPRRDSGSQSELVAQLTEHLGHELVADPPAAVVVQGDTSSALVGALTAFWHKIPVVHLEAGLRSHDLAAPFPEEANRRMIGQIAALHLAPTPAAAMNLLSEGVGADHIEVIGNTAVDAVLTLAGRTHSFAEPALATVEKALAYGRRLLLVTVHRRESWGQPLRSVLHAVREILDAHPDTIAALPAHPNPTVRADVLSVLGADHRVVITEPLDYPDLVRLLELSSLVLSDSGGIQEEAPTFGVPVLVLRDQTERLEAIEAGCALLVGTDRHRITAAANRLLTAEPVLREQVGLRNPFGDGRAAERAAVALARLVGVPVLPMAPFEPPQPGVEIPPLPVARAETVRSSQVHSELNAQTHG